jgi:2,3-bisphosphoglycerate-independent phosphoglycerate mutase
VTLYPGVSYRNIMVDSSGRRGEGRDWSKLVTTPPHDIPGEPIRKYLPKGGPNAELLQAMIEESADLFDKHEINETRRELGELPATHLWPWGQGQRPDIPSFESRFGLRGAMITAVDLLAGIASFIGWDRLDVPGQTSYHDTDYVAAGEHAIAALDDYDIVCVHIEAPDEAGHQADPMTKVAAIEAMDEHVVGPILDALEDRGEAWRVLYLPDHYTAVGTRKHDPTPVPFAICGKRVRSLLSKPFNEKHAAESDLHIAFGHELMEYFLFSGLA